MDNSNVGTRTAERGWCGLTIDTSVVRSVMLSLAIIGWVLAYKGYLPGIVEVPLAWGTFSLYLIRRRVFIIERNK
jgi:hypothetical protein